VSKGTVAEAATEVFGTEFQALKITKGADGKWTVNLISAGLAGGKLNSALSDEAKQTALQAQLRTSLSDGALTLALTTQPDLKKEGFAWEVGGWGDCVAGGPDKCGDGTQERTVGCGGTLDELDRGATVRFPFDACKLEPELGEPPATRQSCSVACPSGFPWVPLLCILVLVGLGGFAVKKMRENGPLAQQRQPDTGETAMDRALELTERQ